MDLREIQALHAQYANNTSVIDLAGRFASIPAPLLLAPSQPIKRKAPGQVLPWVYRAGIVAILGVAIAFAGREAAVLWHKSDLHHAQIGTAAVASQPALAKVAPVLSAVTPTQPAPLTASDFGGADAPTAKRVPNADPLAHVDTAALVPEAHRQVAVVSEHRPDDKVMVAPILQPAAINPKVERVDVPAATPSAPVDAKLSKSEGSPSAIHRSWRERRSHEETAAAVAKATNPVLENSTQHAQNVPAAPHAGGDVSLF